MKYDLLVCDYDGTTAEKGSSTIDKEVVDTIKRYTKKGGKFAICSGRPFGSIKQIMNAHDIEGYIMSNQGAVIGCSKNFEIIEYNGIDAEDCIELIKKFLEEKQSIVVYTAHDYYYEEYTPIIEFYEKRLKQKGVKVDSLIEHVKSLGTVVARVALLCDGVDCSKLVDKYNAIYKGEKIIFNSGATHVVEAVSNIYHKGYAVKYLAEYLNIPFEKVIAVGDSDNDIPLLDGDWHSVAVGDAKELLKEMADEITVPFDQKPIKVLLEKYCLND